MISESERKTAQRAINFLSGACVTQLIQSPGRKTERLALDFQTVLALREAGYKPGGLSARFRKFMRDYYQHARDLKTNSAKRCSRALPNLPRKQVVGGAEDLPLSREPLSTQQRAGAT